MNTKNEGPTPPAPGLHDSLNTRKFTIVLTDPVPDRRRPCVWCGIPFQPRAEIDELCDKCQKWHRAASHHSIVVQMLNAAADL